MGQAHRTKAIVLSLAAVAPAQSATPKVEELAPISKWHVEWQPDSCTLRRMFGSADNFILFQLERFGPTDAFQLVLSGKRLSGLVSPRGFAIVYGVDGFVHEVPVYRNGKLDDGTPSIFISTSSLASLAEEQPAQPAIAPEVEAGIRQITLRRSGREIVLKTGSLGNAFKELRTCTDQLIESWGLSIAEQKTIVRQPEPIGNPGRWATTNDYPAGALSGGQQGLVNFRLIVGTDGVPTGCRVQSSYSGKPFDELTCRLLQKRARFRPATDASGKPIASFYRNSVIWLAGPS